MRDITSALSQFAYHSPDEDNRARHEKVRLMMGLVVEGIFETVPEGPERTLALRALQQCSMYCNLAIAMTSPVVPIPGLERYWPSPLAD